MLTTNVKYMDYRKYLLESLRLATLLVYKTSIGDIELLQFIDEYNNHYYSEALDGHEANEDQRQILAQFESVINFQRRIQFEVVDKLYLGEMESIELARIGRLGESEAIQKLKDLSKEHNVGIMLTSLLNS